MDDLVKSFKAHLYDRVSSPLLSSFAIAWLLWNHRLIAVLFSSDLKIFEKFVYIDLVIFPTWREVAACGFLYPLISALVLIFIYPIPGRWIYEYVRKEQKRLKEIRHRIDDETPLTLEAARGLRAEIYKVQEEVDAKDRQIATLRLAIKELEVKAAQQAGVAQDPFAGVSLSERQEKILAITAAHPDIQLLYFQQVSSASAVVIAQEVDELIDQSMVVASGPTTDVRLSVTRKGRRYLVERAPTLLNEFIEKTLQDISID